MADNDQPSRLEAATVKAEAGSQIVSDFANLPAGQTVATASGNIPTLAGVIGVIQDEGDQAAADVRAKADAQVQAAIGTLVKKAGDTMTGALTLSGAPTANLHAATKKYADDGDAATLASSKAYTDSKTSTLQISKYFESTPRDMVASTGITIAHGLGVRPKFVSGHLVCKTTNPGNYAIGDILELPPKIPNSANTMPIYDLQFDATNLYIYFGANLNLYVTPKGGGTPTNLGGSIDNYFRIVVKAIA